MCYGAGGGLGCGILAAAIVLVAIVLIVTLSIGFIFKKYLKKGNSSFGLSKVLLTSLVISLILSVLMNVHLLYADPLCAQSPSWVTCTKVTPLSYSIQIIINSAIFLFIIAPLLYIFTKRRKDITEIIEPKADQKLPEIPQNIT